MKGTCMAYGDRPKSIEEGDASEMLFSQIMLKRGWSLVLASMQDQFNHIDFYLNKEGIEITVDVKSKKRLSAHDSGFMSGWLWVEFAGHGGGKGWLYGDQTHIAFHLEGGFLVVSRESLSSFCESRVDLDSPTWEWATEPKEAKYKVYRRWSANGGQSLEKSALIKVEHIKKHLAHKFISVGADEGK